LSYEYEQEEDLVDPATEIKEKCAEDHCSKYKAKLDECNERVRNSYEDCD
jgi:Ubiquinol-cytochrome C reductase hinge protein